ncbi:Protein of unknown function DM4/12 [Trinorchestia longiramus]|nr:Protein of unknown function DM4/12 [Trinorchestia longiramus]
MRASAGGSSPISGMISPKNTRISNEFVRNDKLCRAHAPGIARPTFSKLVRSLMLFDCVSPSQYIPNFIAIASIFPLKPGSETRLLVRARTCLVVAGIICLACSEYVEGTSLNSEGSVAIETSRGFREASACGGLHSLTRGDVGTLLPSSMPFNPLRTEVLEPVKSRQRRYLAFPDGSTLSLKTAIDIPIGSLYSGNKLLGKYIEYAFVIQLPSEKLIFTGLKDVFKFPKGKKEGYGAPRPDTVIYGSSTHEDYGPPELSQENYGLPQSPPASYGPPQSPPASYGPPQSPPASSGPPPSLPQGYGPPQSPPASYGPPQSPPQSSSPPQSPLESYGPPQSSPESNGPSESPPDLYGPPQSHSELGFTFGVPAAGGEQNGDSSYSSLSKDLEGHSSDKNKTHNLEIFTQSSFSYSNPNLTLGGEAYEDEGSEWQEPLHDLPPDAVAVIMSPLDHQRLLGFLSIEKTFDSAGLPGRWCLLKAVCEIAAEPLTEFGLLGEMVNLFLAAGYGDGSPALVEYMIAEEIGYMDGSCDRHFHACKVDLVALLSSGAAALGGGLASAAG